MHELLEAYLISQILDDVEIQKTDIESCYVIKFKNTNDFENVFDTYLWDDCIRISVAYDQSEYFKQLFLIKHNIVYNEKGFKGDFDTFFFLNYEDPKEAVEILILLENFISTYHPYPNLCSL